MDRLCLRVMQKQPGTVVTEGNGFLNFVKWQTMR